MIWYRLPITCLTVSALCFAQSAKAPSGNASGNSSISGPRRYGIDFAVYVSCQIQALLNGYYSPQQVVAGNDPAGQFDAGTLRPYKKELGRVNQIQKKGSAARECFEKALAADPKFPPPSLRLALAEKTARRGLSQHAEQRCPQIFHALGMVLAAEGRLEEAIAEYERFFKIAPNHPDRPAAEQQLAIIRKNL